MQTSVRPVMFHIVNTYTATFPPQYLLRNRNSSTDTYTQSRQSAIGFFSSRPNWDPLTRNRVCPPPLVLGGTLARGRRGGVRGPNSDEGTDTCSGL
jgi:hypothetical protein